MKLAPATISTAPIMSASISYAKNFDTFGEGRTEPDYPDIPDTASLSEVTNEAFLDAIFWTLPEGASITVTSIKGDPQPTKGRVNWSYAPRDKVKTPATANNYFCISSSYPNDAGEVKRTKACFASLHAIVLDDVGQKVTLDRVTLTPSWAIETSPDNFQYGYILDEPIKEAPAAERLLNAFIEAGLSDKGAGGATARNMRLPVAINGKAKYFDADGKPWQCRLTIWQPELHYSVNELVNHFELDLAPTRPPKERKSKHASLADAIDANDGADVYVPRPSENPVIAALKNRGLYKQPLGDGRHDITCPWVNEHTDQHDGGSAYFEPSDTYVHGGFKCQHSHGEKYRLGALLEYLQVTMSAARMKPTIRITGGELNRIVDRAERELLSSGQHYQRGGIIVTIATDPATNESAIQFVSQPALTRALSAVSLWERFDGRSED